MDGIYSIYFTGNSGMGQAMLMIKDAIVNGADAAGVTLDGTLDSSRSDTVDIKLDLAIPPGIMIATGFINSDNRIVHQQIKETIPKNFGNGQPILIHTPTGPMNVVFRLLRQI